MDHSNNNRTATGTEKPLEALEYPYQVFLITLYSCTAGFAFISNLLTVVVLVKGKRCTRDLRKFLINLAVTDLLMAVFTIPFTYTNYMLGRWIFFSLMCPIVNCAQLTTITVSIYTLVAIAIDRYVAIMHPLQKSISWFKQHRTLIVVMIWAVGLALGLSQLYVSETNTFHHGGHEYLSCGERWTPESTAGRLYTAFIFATTFALPMGALCVIYSAMGCRLLRYRGPEQQQQQLQQRQQTKTTCAQQSYRHNHHHHRSKLLNSSKSLLNNNHIHHNNNDNDNGNVGNRPVPSSLVVAMNKDSDEERSSTTATGGDGGGGGGGGGGGNDGSESEPTTGSLKIKCTNGTRHQPPTTAAVAASTTANHHEQHSVCYKSAVAAGSGNQLSLPIENNTESGSYHYGCCLIKNYHHHHHHPHLQHHHQQCNHHHHHHNSYGEKSNTKFNDKHQRNMKFKCQVNRAVTIHQRTGKLMNIRRNKVLKMLITIIGVFTACWLPIQLFNILIYFKPNFLHVNSEFKYYAFVGSYFFCHWISMAHSFMNPIIYSFMSKNFRSDMKTIFSNLWSYCMFWKKFGSFADSSGWSNQHQQQQNEQNYYYNHQSSRRDPHRYHQTCRMVTTAATTGPIGGTGNSLKLEIPAVNKTEVAAGVDAGVGVDDPSMIDLHLQLPIEMMPDNCYDDDDDDDGSRFAAQCDPMLPSIHENETISGGSDDQQPKLGLNHHRHIYLSSAVNGKRKRKKTTTGQ